MELRELTDLSDSIRWGLLAGMLAALGCAALSADALAAPRGDFRANEVIVKYKTASSRTRETMAALYDLAGVSKVRRYSTRLKGLEELVLDGRTKVQDAIAALRANPLVEYAQPNYILHILPVQPAESAEGALRHAAQACVPGVDSPGCDPQECVFPGMNFPPGCHDAAANPPAQPSSRPALLDRPESVNPPAADPEIEKEYALRLIGATEVWKQHRGRRSFIVADIDTGADYNHEDLAYNLWRNPHPSDKGDVVGFDFVHNDGLPFDDHQHGTHTSGTIAAVHDNGKGISGVIPEVSLMVLKFLDRSGNGTTADAIRAIDYAIDHGARIINNSWGGTGDDDNQALKEAIDRARDRDVLFVAAAGNDGANNDGDDPSYPAAFDNDNLISVAATDANDHLSFFSNYGKKTTHLAAPGVGILSTLPGNRYAQLSGTSMACPQVAGAAALVWTRHPKWNYRQVKQALLDAVDKVPELADKTITGGRLNVLKAMHFEEE